MLDIIIASFLLLRVDRFITASVTSAAHASVKQVVSSRESGGKKVYFYCDTPAVLWKNRPENDLYTVIWASHQRFTTVLMSVSLGCVTDMKRIHTAVEGHNSPLSCRSFLLWGSPANQLQIAVRNAQFCSFPCLLSIITVINW